MLDLVHSQNLALLSQALKCILSNNAVKVDVVRATLCHPGYVTGYI